MLPLEAIELDALRRQHEHDTFWCGLLLRGCGLQLTTKLHRWPADCDVNGEGRCNATLLALRYAGSGAE
ncbi:hypothetical protein [Streptomyces sp. NRRL S-378]|uniref:hypothetical protein n=1 Tax=Streptomyces sp. NRRL S-378 TaxID=1463904 RepID=UPI0004C4AA60|nr:hypothetical protein [Streptomyces sp. NRRL S-378]